MERVRRFCTCDRGARSKIKSHVQGYCAATTIHGVQYLAEPGRPLAERLWWVIVFILSFCVNSYMISKIWQKWNETPVIVSFDEKVTPIWEVPFPAITICSLATFDARIFNFSKHYMEAVGSQKLSDVSMLCEGNEHPEVPNWLAEGNEFTSDNILDFFDEIGVEKEDMIIGGSWRDNVLDNTMISEILTENGYCYTFNMLDYTELYTNESGVTTPDIPWLSEKWTIEKGYPKDLEVARSYPFRVSNSGLKEGFRIYLKADLKNYDYLCHGYSPGFKVTIHHPAQFPHVRDKYFRVPIGKEVIVGVTPDIMKTSDSLTKYKPEDRQCYFIGEKKLAFFKIYSQHNCEFECLTNHTLIKCGCVGFYMPRLNSSVPICGIGSWSCIYNVITIINEELIQTSTHTLGEPTDEASYKCQCMPSCSTIKYQTDVSQSSIQLRDLLKFYPNNSIEDIETEHISILQVYFFEKYFTSSKRSELYGYVDFIANAGGLLSLFSGLSFLSIIEIVYWLSLRCYNNVKSHIDEQNESARDECAQELEEISPLKTKEV